MRLFRTITCSDVCNIFVRSQFQVNIRLRTIAYNVCQGSVYLGEETGLDRRREVAVLGKGVCHREVLVLENVYPRGECTFRKAVYSWELLVEKTYALEN